MKNLYLYLFLYASCFCYGANPLPSKGKKGSKTNPAITTHTIRFDKAGKIAGGYPSIIRKGDKLIFVVEDKTPLPTPLTQKIINYKNKIINTSVPVLPDYFFCMDDIDDFNSYKCSIDSYLPTTINGEYFDKNKVYKVKITIKGSKSTKTLDCEVNYSSKFGTTDVIDIQDDNKDYGEIEEITFQLIKTNVDNTIIKNYLDSVKATPGFKNWDKYREAYITHKANILKESQEIDRLISLWELDKQTNSSRANLLEPSVCCEYQTELCKKLEKIKCENEAIIALTEWILKENCEWIKKWLWLTGLDNPSLNPFIVSDVSAEEIKNVTEEIAALQAQIEVLKASFARTSIPEKEGKTYRDFLAKLDTLNQEATRASNRKASLLDYQKKYNDWLARNTIESQLLYAGQLFISKPERIIWMPQFDASYNYKLMNPDKSIPDLIAERDAINPLAINVKRGTVVTSQETVKPFVIKTRISEVIDEQWGNTFDSLLVLAKNLGIGALEPLLNKSISSTISPENGQKATPEKAVKATATEKEIINILLKAQKDLQVLSAHEIDEILKEKMSEEARKFFEELKTLVIQKSTCLTNIDLYNKAKSYLSWLDKQTPPILELKLKANEDTLLHTDWAQSKQKAAKKGSVEVTYSLKASDGKKTDTVVEEQVYKQYETTRFWYGVGLAYVPSPRYTSEYDITTKAFKENPEPQQLDIVVGMKWYPCKMNQMHTRERARYTAYEKKYQLPRGNALQNRFSVFFGLGVRYKFLRNYFLGAGYDIVPGLNINGGVNAYFQRRYEFENGQLKQSYDQLKMNRGYIAITTDVAVFSRFIKLINPF